MPLLWSTIVWSLASFAYGQTLQTLYSFRITDGRYPQCVLVEASDGTFYGTTHYGGSNDVGTVFKLTTNIVLTTLVQFDAGTNGRYPQSGLVLAIDGSLYGTTYKSTVSPTSVPASVFRVTPDGQLFNSCCVE